MSGIAGIIHFDGKPVEPGLIEKMTGAMAHRGPDGINHWVKGSVALGQCMLRTTPESLEEHQPLSNEDESLVLVMDGRVDNWEELRRELLGRGAVLRNRADAELVLRAYEIWGRDCLGHIDGDFALVIWDVRRREAFCARDRMGNKPFNYHWDGKTFVFASELHAILALPWMSEIINEGMLAEYLAWEHYSRDETLWMGIMRLVAAHLMTVDHQGLQPQIYWAPDLWATLPYTKDQDYIDHYREVFADSVRRLSRSLYPVAFEVSGGLDSSAVFCMAEYLRCSNHLPAPSIAGYTLAFTGESSANELTYARAVGEHLAIQIYEIPPSRMPLSWFEECVCSDRDFPSFPNAAMFLEIRRQVASKGIRVLLTGEGGDEWLRGSRVYYAEELAQRRFSTLYDCFRKDVSVYGFRWPINWLSRQGIFLLLPATLQDEIRQLVRKISRRKSRYNAYWLSPKMREVIVKRRERFCPPHNRPIRLLGQKELLDTLYDAFSDHVMERVERLGSRFQIEMRYPLRAPQFVQYAFSTPERLRLRGDTSKYIHIQGLQDLMPNDILERKSKAEFSIISRGYLDRMKEVFTEKIPREQVDWVAPEGMAQLFQFYQDNPQYGWPLWVLWSLYGCHLVMTQTQSPLRAAQ